MISKLIFSEPFHFFKTLQNVVFQKEILSEQLSIIMIRLVDIDMDQRYLTEEALFLWSGMLTIVRQFAERLSINCTVCNNGCIICYFEEKDDMKHHVLLDELEEALNFNSSISSEEYEVKDLNYAQLLVALEIGITDRLSIESFLEKCYEETLKIRCQNAVEKHFLYMTI